MRFEYISGQKIMQEPPMKEQNGTMKIIDLKTGQGLLESRQKTEYYRMTFELNYPSFQPVQLCGDRFANISQAQNLSLLSNLDLTLIPGTVLELIHNPRAYIPSTNALPVQCRPARQDNIRYELQENWQGGGSQGETVYKDCLYGV
jgi:hypothetical protein